jgi:DNA-binding response OmpR family regulator
MDAAAAIDAIQPTAGAVTATNALAATRVLILDADPAARDTLSLYLGLQGFVVHGVQQPAEVDILLGRHEIDLVIAVARGPSDTVLSLCRGLHGGDKPRLIVAGDFDDTDRILALELGADDCLPALYSYRELLARSKAILRSRAGLPAMTPGLRRFMGLTFDFTRPVLLRPNGAPISLTPGEFSLLRVFLTHPGRVLSRDELLDQARGETEVYDRVVDVQISRLRQKLAQYAADQAIRTHRHAGYQFVARLQ